MLLSLKDFTQAFRDDQDFWDLRQEESEKFLFAPLELLHAALDVFRGREYLYHQSSPLVCRCFGVRESDIVEHLTKEALPTLEGLARSTKAGMGCRSCVPQLKRWLVVEEARKSHHFYKEKPVAEWLLEIDYMLSCFPKSLDWKMEVLSFKKKQVIIGFDKEVGQREEEETGKELQDFLGASIDSDLGFFLSRARHFSKA
jgi:bacterioferritin-associated ferredoxin